MKIYCNPKNFGTPRLLLSQFKLGMRYYILDYCRNNKERINTINKNLKEVYPSLSCSAQKILLLSVQQLRADVSPSGQVAFELDEELRLNSVKVSELLRFIENGNLNCSGSTILREAKSFALKRL